MQMIGDNNKIIFKINDKIIDYDSNVLNDLDIKINGNNNIIIFNLFEDETIAEFKSKKHLEIKLNGNNNVIDLGSFKTAYEPNKGIIGLEILIGGNLDEITNNSLIKTGNNISFTGVSLHVKEDNSKIVIGDNSIFSWITYIWCTDGHTILNDKNEIINRGYSIDIGSNVWVGKDVKICKNTKISDNSVVGWNSVVTKKFNEKNVIIAGNPAKIIRKNIKWHCDCISKYEKNN